MKQRMSMPLDSRESGAKRGVEADDWVFPTTNGKLRQPSCLNNAFRAALQTTNINKRVSPHGLRYFFNDILRLAGVDAVSARSLTGHVTEEMREHYSTVRLDEKRAVMERVAERLRVAKVDDKVDFSVDLARKDQNAARTDDEKGA